MLKITAAQQSGLADITPCRLVVAIMDPISHSPQGAAIGLGVE